MKPSVKLVRYLAVLAPLALGLVLSGCGGLLGPVNGRVPAPTITLQEGGQPVTQVALSSTAGSTRVVQVSLPPGATSFTASVISGQDLINLIVSALSRQQEAGQLIIETVGGKAGTAIIRVVARNSGGAIVAQTDLTVVVSHPQGTGTGG